MLMHQRPSVYFESHDQPRGQKLTYLALPVWQGPTRYLPSLGVCSLLRQSSLETQEGPRVERLTE
jgi:hypothetical protein